MPSKYYNLSTDTTLGGNSPSDYTIPSEKAIKTYVDNNSGGGGGTATDVQINGTSITSNNVANIITNTAYNASSNKIATMADIATDLNGKADTDLSNVPNSKAILVSSYKSGTSWCNIYANGWCEQGGEVLDSTYSTPVALIQNYVSTNYEVLLTPYQNGVSVFRLYTVVSRLTNSFTFNYATLTGSGTGTGIVIWQASGYIR